MIKKDGKPVTQVEADQINELIPQDYFSEKYFERQTKDILVWYVGGLAIASTGIATAALFFKTRTGSSHLLDNT